MAEGAACTELGAVVMKDVAAATAAAAAAASAAAGSGASTGRTAAGEAGTDRTAAGDGAWVGLAAISLPELSITKAGAALELDGAARAGVGAVCT